MIVTANKYVNARVGKASTDAPSQFYRRPGDSIEIAEVLVGTEIEGNNIWYKNKIDDCFYWSGAAETIFPSYILDFGINYLWNETMGKGVKVFIVDSGFKSYESLAIATDNLYSVVPNSNETDQIGHGTLMSNIIAGKSIENFGIATEVEIISIKITDEKKGLKEFLLIKALDLIDTLITESDYCVINLSLTLGIKNNEIVDPITEKLVKIMNRKNCIVVTAVGNDSFFNDYKTFPAQLKNIVCVAGLNIGPGYTRIRSSNYWENISIAAPGDFSNSNLKHLFPRLDIQGSSQATAFISGIAALVLSKAKGKNRSIDTAYFDSFIRSSSVKRTETKPNRIFFYNILDKNNLINQFKTI